MKSFPLFLTDVGPGVCSDLGTVTLAFLPIVLVILPLVEHGDSVFF